MARSPLKNPFRQLAGLPPAASQPAQFGSAFFGRGGLSPPAGARRAPLPLRPLRLPNGCKVLSDRVQYRGMAIPEVRISKSAKRALKKVPGYIVDKLETWVDAVEGDGLHEVR